MDTKPPVDMEQLLEAVGGVEDEARAIAQLYMDQAREILQRLEVAARDGALPEIEHLAHRLAGCSASCGMEPLVTPLRELEHSARRQQLPPEMARALYQQTRQIYEQVEQFLITTFPENSGQ